MTNNASVLNGWFVRLATVRMLCVEETKSVQLMTSQQWWAGPTAKLNVF